MTEGEKIQSIRILERQALVQEERIATLEKELYAIKEIMKSPIRRNVYAASQKHKSQSDVGEH